MTSKNIIGVAKIDKANKFKKTSIEKVQMQNNKIILNDNSQKILKQVENKND